MSWIARRSILCLSLCLSAMGIYGVPYARAESINGLLPSIDAPYRERLLRAAADPALDDWQREFMRQLAAASSPRNAPRAVTERPMPASNSDAWEQLPPPSARREHTAIFDPPRNRMIVYGGETNQTTGELWELRLDDPPVWRQIHAAGDGPSWRQGHSAIYDPVRQRMIVYGGHQGWYVYASYCGDVWALSLTDSPTWTVIAAHAPTEADSLLLIRTYSSAIYDGANDRMVICGGYSPNSTHSAENDAWALPLTGDPAWTRLVPAENPAPPRRAKHSAIYDQAHNRMVIFGGTVSTTSGGLLNDVWALSLQGTPAWTQLLSGTEPGAPAPRCGHTAIVDSDSARMIVHGGETGFSLYAATNDVWSLSLGGSPVWSQIVCGGALPPARDSHTAVYDPAQGRMLVFSGDAIGASDPSPTDTWALSLRGAVDWAVVPANGGRPPACLGASAVFDAMRDRMVVFGGTRTDPSGLLLNETWALSLDGDPIWRHLEPTGTLPPARTGHSAVYDAVHDRMVIFGGYAGAYRNDCWALSFAEPPHWTRLSPAGNLPSPRVGHTAVYDPGVGQMIMFGGYSGSYRSDAWAFDLGPSPVWTELSPAANAPSGRFGHTAIFDVPHQRMLVFGGRDDFYSFNDTWSFTSTPQPAWTMLLDDPSGLDPLPSPRCEHTAVYDEIRQRMVVFGGTAAPLQTNSGDPLWALPLDDPDSWTQLVPVGAPPSWTWSLESETAIFDPQTDRMVVHGTQAGQPDYALKGGSTTAAGAPDGDHPWHCGLAPNPARSSVQVSFLLPAESHVGGAVFDLAGRRVHNWSARRFPEGMHSLGWDLILPDGRRASPGVYFVRLNVNGDARSTRLVVIR